MQVRNAQRKTYAAGSVVKQSIRRPVPGSQPRKSKIYGVAGTLVQHEVVVVAIRIS